MDTSNIDIVETQNQLQNYVKSESEVSFGGFTILKMNFKQLFTIVHNQVGKRIWLPKNQKEFKIIIDQILVDGQPIAVTYSENPQLPTYVTCSVCNGTGSVNSNPCMNCGGQYNDGTPTGSVLMNLNGDPCTHDYITEDIFETYIHHKCDLCGDAFTKSI